MQTARRPPALAWKHQPEVVFWVRRLACPDAAVVAITSVGEEGAVRQAEGGFLHYLVEPIDPVQVHALLKKLERRAGDR